MSQVSVLLVRHDAAGHIEKDPKSFWRAAWHAMQHAASTPQTFGIGSAYPVGIAVGQGEEFGFLQLIAVGEGTADVWAVKVPDVTAQGLLGDTDTKHALLKEAAQKIGYRLTKIPAPRVRVAAKKKKKHKKKRKT